MSGELMNYFCSKGKPASYALTVLVLCCGVCSGTTILVIITPTGIVIGADSKMIAEDFGGYSAPLPAPGAKVFPIHKRIAVATVGIGKMVLTTMDDRPLVSYDPDVWFSEIEKETPKDVTVGGLTEIVKNKSRRTFSSLGTLVNNGAYNQSHNLNTFEYLIAGYENGVPSVQRIYFEFDWAHKKLIGPTYNVILPQPDARVDFGFHPAGETSAIEDIINRKLDSPSYREIMAAVPAELNMLLARKDLTTKQSTALLHAMLRAQAKCTPQYVGPPYVISLITKNGFGETVSYGD
jgi:hypothetical protein